MEVTIKKSIHSLKTAVIILLAVGLAALFSAGETKAQDASEVFTVVDEMPEMIGGMESLYGEIKYPRAAVQAGIEGRVFIQFVVDKNGNVRDEKVLRDIGGGCGEAA